MDTDFLMLIAITVGRSDQLFREPLKPAEVNFAGGDVLCGECRFIIATVYKKIQDNMLPPGTVKQAPDE
jgi:hypothetical protein